MNVRRSNIKVIVFFIIILCFVMFLLSLVNEDINSDLEEITGNSMTQLFEQQMHAFNRELENERNGIESMVNAISTFYTSDEGVLQYIESVKDNFHYETVMLVDSNGNGLLSTGESISLTTESYFITALRGRSGTTEPYISQFTGDTVMAVSVPIYYEGEIQAVIAAEYSTKYLNSLLESSVRGEGYAMVTNSNAEILLSTNLSGVDALRIDESEFYGDVDGEQVMLDILTGTANSASFILEGARRVVTYMPLNYNDWMIVYVMPEEVVTAGADEISRVMLMMSVASILVFVAFSVYIVRADRKSITMLEYTAYYDDLTGIRNLTKFKIDVDEVLRKYKDRRFYMIKFDVVNFKAINELFGYEVGNEVIKALAEPGKRLRQNNFIQARMGTDEFIMFGEYDFFNSMDDLILKFEKSFKEALSSAENHQIQFRIGRYLIEENEHDVNEMVSKTSMAHSRVKEETGTAFYDYEISLMEKILKTADITNKMDSALATSEFKVYLQPKNNLQNDKIVGAEALVRWQEANGNMIFPNEFIPIFESNGFITKLDMYMLDNVCKLLSSWIKAGKECIPISVNFSRVNISNPNFVDDIRTVVERNGVPIEYIEIELTETSVTENEIVLNNLLKRLHTAGFAVSIDDFGSGYSSLGMLKNMRADTLKLDRSFFLESDEEVRGSMVVEGIIKIAHDLQMLTVAEGIEDMSQVEQLKKWSCDAAQGFFYAKPMPISEFEALLFG